MNRYKNYILTALFIFSLIACSDVLDKGPLDKYSENDIWNDADLTQAFIYKTLKNTTDKLIMQDKWTDNSFIQEASSSTAVNKEQIDRYHDAGWDVYADIRRCNMILLRVPESPNLLDKEKEYFIAQAKAMRAIIYFSRARLFGKLMIVDRILDPEEEMEFPRTSTIKETYDFILKDLQEAAPGLPVSLNSQQGMLTRGAAYAFLAEAALHGAAYIESGKETYYDIAKEASENLFSLGVYELDNNYQSMFNEFNHSLNSKEIILAQWRHETNTNFAGTWMQELIPNTDNTKNIEAAWPKFVEEFAGWPQSFPSVDLVADYLVVDEDGKAKDWDKTSYYQDFLENGGSVSDAIYKNRDNRFYASVVYDSTAFFKNMVTTRINGNLHWRSNAGGDWGMTKTGYLYRKCVYEAKRLLNSESTYYHYTLMRLGRAYLNYAEVMLRKGDLNKAVEYINKTRVGHGGLPALSGTLSAEEVWKEYKRERRLELLQEGDRYWSLLRWGKADGLDTIEELNKVHLAIEIAEDGQSFEIITPEFKVSDNERLFTNKRYLFPVPQAQIDLNPSLDQNPGW
ncbi:RagB/SusD family nutrient uptake outer membrane protein [Parabacteroides sp. OttesenSCG-928-K15]|nr:RagB/SusD family nutrient uptake outer membrane protein [Parabacteroides sp. OttesenSCG-928-K15]